MTKVFFDMDGTLNVWEMGEHIDVVSAPGYMRNRKPIASMVEASRILSEEGYDVWIASAVLPYEHSIPDKDYWLDKHCPWIPKENRIYMQFGTKKSDALKGLICPGDVFLDDYTPNLEDLQKHFADTGLVCVKVLNGINDTNHSWQGKRLSIASEPKSIAETIEAFSILKRMSSGDIEFRTAKRTNCSIEAPHETALTQQDIIANMRLMECTGIPYILLPAGTKKTDITNGIVRTAAHFLRHNAPASGKYLQMQGQTMYCAKYDDESYILVPEYIWHKNQAGKLMPLVVHYLHPNASVVATWRMTPDFSDETGEEMCPRQLLATC